MKKIKTLAIETSCDDTSIGIISYDGKTFETEKLTAYSQIKQHQEYGGVVPELASRLHQEKIISVIEKIGRDEIDTIDFISITTHPGLPGSLLVGKAAANLLWTYFHKPVIDCNHIEWHIFSLLLGRSLDDIVFPFVVLTASGGHNDIYLVTKSKDQSIKFDIEKLGRSIDDAAGEAFDKVSRMLWWPYPGGPWISKMANNYKAQWDANKDFWLPDVLIQPHHNLWSGKFFKRIRLDKAELDFSFSGMKSQIYNYLKKLENNNIELTESLIQVIAHEFQEAVVEVMSEKLIKAGLDYNAKTIAIAGWVSANDRLNQYIIDKLQSQNSVLKFIAPTKKVYSTDNAAMIWVIGILNFFRKIGNY